MDSWWRFARSLAVMMAVLALAAGCSSSGDDVEAAERSAEEILTASSAAMAEVETVSFTIEQTGADLYIDEAGILAFQGADGRFARPASADALVTVAASGFTTETGVVAIGGEVWFTNPLTGIWSEAPEGLNFDPASVFDPDDGLPAMLSEVAPTAELVEEAEGTEGSDSTGSEVPGPEGTLHLVASVGADRVSVLTAGLTTEQTDVELWIDPETDLIVEIRFDLATEDGISNWRMTVSDYGAEVVIEPPELGTAG
jgi:hypothetical protein